MEGAANRAVITTARVRLRHFTYSDAAFLVTLLNDPDFLRHIGDRGVRTTDDAKAYLDAGPLASYRANGFGLWCAEHRDSGEPLGICGLLRRETLPAPDVGYALLPAARGQGYAREAVAGVLAHARDVLQISSVVAIVSPDNPRSAQLLESLGYRRTQLVVAAPGANPVWLYESGAAAPAASPLPS